MTVMKSRFRLLAFGAVALTAAACATSTPYQPADQYGRGFSEQQIESDRFRISFSGNTLTPRETVENYLLFRAAELTKQRGYDYFVVLERDVESETDFVTQSTGFYGYHRFPYYVNGLYARHYFGYPPYGDTVTRERTEYTATAELKLFQGEKPADNPLAYNANEVIQNLAPYVERPASY